MKSINFLDGGFVQLFTFSIQFFLIFKVYCVYEIKMAYANILFGADYQYASESA